MTVQSPAPRCAGSGKVMTVNSPDDWAADDYATCHLCSSRVRFRIRATDLAPWARFLPHRTDGKPCR